MKLVSVNVGQLERIENSKKSGKTGIFKVPASGPVMVTAEGLVNDAIADTKHHGGPDQAIYVYGLPDYAWWSAELGADLGPGTFGDNLTISDLKSAQFNIGDRLLLDSVILEVTAARIPCSTLAARMGDRTFVKRFRAAERPGLYCRVIQTGSVQAGETVRYEAYAGETVAILESFRDFYDPNLSADNLRRYLAAPIAIRDRVEKEEKLSELLTVGRGVV